MTLAPRRPPAAHRIAAQQGPAGTVTLVGPPGAGKTTVGALLARRLGVPFLDLDEEIAVAAGRSVPEIFADEGESGFRARERAAALALDGPRPRVVSAGGGALADAEVRGHLASLGPLVCLLAPATELAHRLAAAPTRPLLPQPTPDAVARLLLERRDLYGGVPLAVDTTGRDPAEVEEAVARLVAAAGALPLAAVPVATPTDGYRVVVGAGLLSALGPLLAGMGSGQVLLVTDPNVGPRYAADVSAGLESAGLQSSMVTIAAGEGSKCLATVERLYEAAVDTGLDRDATVLALGGGVVGDTAGFMAATYLRGVRFLPAPTTLLAMVDASLGGKTGVNLPAGKNLVGAFHHPALVAADPTVLASLPAPVLRDGLAEVVKAAVIGDARLLDSLADTGAPPAEDVDAWAAIILRAVRVKAAIVSADPRESGRRAILNLGHTFGHGFERASNYQLTHGQGVSFGLMAAAHLGVRLGRTAPELRAQLSAVLSRLGLPTSGHGLAPAEVLRAMRVDKKRRHGRLRFLLPEAPGRVTTVTDVADADVLAVLAALQ